MIRLLLGDCLEVMRTLDAASIDAVVSDPPYGMDWNTDSTRFSGFGPSGLASTRGLGRADWGDIESDAEPFDPAPWLEFPKVILWGANHYNAKLPTGTTLVWIKRDDHLFGSFLSDAEIGWMKGGHGVYCYRKQFPPPCRIKEGGGKVAHPTQKPIGLMKWCLGRLNLPEGATVLDPYMGSGTTGVACLKMGLDFIGIESNARHFATAQRRIDEARTPLFAEAP